MKKVYFSHIKNPMTIISLFVGVIELILGLSLIALPDNLKPVIVWFLVLFPVLNAIAFFIVLILYPHHFYGPHDYRNDQSFLSSLRVGKGGTAEKPAQADAQKEKALQSTQHLPASEDEITPTEKTWFSYMFDKEYEKAIESLKDALAQAKSSEDKVRLKTLIGHCKIQMDFQTGITYFEQLIDEYPTEEGSYDWLAYTYLWNDLPQDCLATIERGLQQVQDQTRLAVTKAKCLAKLGRDDEAITLLEEATTDSPSRIEYYLTLTELLSEHDSDTAEEWYKKGLSVFPRNEELLSKYAQFLVGQNRNEEALYRYSTLTQLAPENEAYFALLGNAYLILGLSDNALEAYTKANTLAEGKEPWIIANIGNLYKNQGFYSKGIEYLNQALEMAPVDEYAHDRLAQAIKKQTEENKRAEELLKQGQRLSLKE
jgi:tetratricopeptide (TPR) repeat protein